MLSFDCSIKYFEAFVALSELHLGSVYNDFVQR